MVEPSHARSPNFVVGAGRMLVFDPSDEQSGSDEIKETSIHVDGSGNRYAVLEQLAGGVRKQKGHFVRKGRVGLGAFPAAGNPQPPSIRIILEAPHALTSSDLY